MSSINLTTADRALKSFYLDVLTHQLNTTTNPLFTKIKANSTYVYGKDVRKPISFGINGGIAAGTETGDLPAAAGNQYLQFTATLKNLYGTLEITDKAVRASENSKGAVVNLLNAEMEGLLAAAKYNFSRMLYGDGNGKLATVTTAAVSQDYIIVDKATFLAIGMVIDIITPATGVKKATGRIISITALESGVQVGTDTSVDAAVNDIVVVQGSFGNEITGLGKIFDSTAIALYGLSKESYSWLNPYIGATVGSISDVKIQKAIDQVEETSGGSIDFISCSYGVRRAYQNYLETTKRNVNTMELEGGFKAISYGGVPIYADKFVDAGAMYLLNTREFGFHQLCDWRWLEGDNGNVLRQIPGKAVYTATLVKYAELLCNKPAGQAMLTGITEA